MQSGPERDSNQKLIGHQLNRTDDLALRLSKDLPFTKIGNRCLIALRPQRRLAISSDNASKEYAYNAKQISAKAIPDELPAHAFGIATSAYFHAIRAKMDQSIVLLGESNSGKSEVLQMLLRNLCDLSRTTSKKTKVHSNLLKLKSVLEAFGNATTVFNENSSCFTQYTELQFDTKGKMVGFKLADYLLEKSRVSGCSDGGKSFHVFYYLLEGATYEERMNLHLSDTAHFEYLSGSKIAGYAQGKGTAPMDNLRTNLKSLGIGRRQQAQLWQLLAAILHLGNVQFVDSTTGRESCTVKNFPQLQMVAEILGVSGADLQGVLTCRTKMVGKDNISSFLNATESRQQRDCFARALYSVAFSWIIEQINLKMSAPDSIWSNFVSIIDIPGFAGNGFPNNGFYRLMTNYANERLLAHSMNEIFVSPRDAFINQNVSIPNENYSSNKEILNVLADVRDGILPMVDAEAVKIKPTNSLTSDIYEKHIQSGVLVSASSKKSHYCFGIHHYGGIVEYDTTDFTSIDSDILQSDFVSLIRGNPSYPGTNNEFLRSIFSDKLIATKKAGDLVTVIAAKSISRRPSMRRQTRNAEENDEQLLDVSSTISYSFRKDLDIMLDNLAGTQPWFIFNLNPFDGASGKISDAAIQRQFKALNLSAIVGNPSVLYTSCYTFEEFLNRYSSVLSIYNRGDAKDTCLSLIQSRKWSDIDCRLGTTSIFLSEPIWFDLELKLRARELEEVEKNLPKNAETFSAETRNAEFRNYPESVDGSEFTDESASHFGSDFEFQNAPIKDLEQGIVGKSKLANVVAPDRKVPIPEKKPLTPLRKKWLCCVWGSSFCFVPACLRICGKMPARERQMAWREKLALCLIIFFMNALVLFIIIGTGFLICPLDVRNPKQSPGEISSRIKLDGKAAVYMYGNYYEVEPIVKNHIANYMEQTAQTPKFFESNVNGKDVTLMFPRQNFPDGPQNGPRYCVLPIPQGFRLRDEGEFDKRWVPHNLDSIEAVRQYWKGPIVVSTKVLEEQITNGGGFSRFIILYDKVYDLTPFYSPTLNAQSNRDAFFLGRYFTDLANFYTRGPTVEDATADMINFRRENQRAHDNVMECLDNLFLIGGVDHRNDLECLISNYILLAFSVILVAVIGFKFIAALQFPGKKYPEDHDRFVICQVPCYTEDDTSLHRTIDSLTNLRYDDKHKLLFIICDGMIIGSGNDRPTPRIVLDILGVDPSVDPESVAYQSLGDGNAQLNYAKVYSGLYELNGHVVPFIVVVKVGKPSERGKPGNRGKRDSQLILMRFLMRVHFNQPMSPLEIEIYHHFKHVIGVDPAAYEYAFMVDADTQVHEDSLNHLVSHMTRDAKIAATCGETSIANDRKSFTSMIQVYEYFISHHMAKAFESLFGSVTCLPGCFCMYRIRTPYKNTPVLIAPGLVSDYSENQVDTLHLKNLLHLGEDRFLTTLTMKHFPNMKTTFCPDASCKTYAPDQWDVLLSQRRRWINSTVHNLFELLRLNGLCGFCCISMRFVVFVDLIATFIQPASLIYVAYLIFLAATNNMSSQGLPIISLIMIACVYGFQVIIFLLKTQWQHIGWMVFYILAIPLFGFYIPIYSFWHFDDFSWGNTRRIEETGETTTKGPENDVFDPASVPLVKWADYESGKTQTSSNSDTQPRGTQYPVSFLPTDYSDSVYAESAIVPVPYSEENVPFPTDEELLVEIKHILSTTDLMKITKKSVRDQLKRLFGVDVSPRKEYIHHCIDSVLKGEL